MNQELWMATHATHFPSYMEEEFQLTRFNSCDPVVYANIKLRSDGEWPR